MEQSYADTQLTLLAFTLHFSNLTIQYSEQILSPEHKDH